MTAAFFIPGRPLVKGNLRTDPKTGRAYWQQSKKLGAWTSDAKLFAAQAWSGPPIEGAVRLTLSFTFARPTSVPAKKRPYHTVRPDVDKLSRAVLDSLMGVAYRDDSQVVESHATKDYGDREGVQVTIEEVRE